MVKFYWEPKPQDCKEAIWRYDANPILKMNHTPKIARLFNSATIVTEDKIVGIFRGDMPDCTPALFYGESRDGINWDIDDCGIKIFEKDGTPFIYEYAYDPRLTKIDDYYYIIFCADVVGPSLYIVRTKDFKYYEKMANGFLPYNRNGVLFPRKFDDKYLFLSRPSDTGHTPCGDIYLSESRDLEYWGNHKLLMTAPYKKSYWQRLKIGAGPIPIETDDCWILIYHGVNSTCNGLVYSMGVALLDKDDPSKVLSRGRRYLMTPEKDYECMGFVPNVVFPCSALCDDEGHVTIYYGSADTTLSIAFTTVDELKKFAKENND